MDFDADQKAITELTTMASAYVDRGQLEKAAELLNLAQKISKRLYRNNIVEITRWQKFGANAKKDARA
ncbi:MAG TPA: hypothetical protein V6C76_15395 [Drouetiella sp.]